MNRDDKQRVIGKVVAITSDRFTVELLTGLENFNINGFDDIHYFAQVNSYVIMPYQNYHIVAEVISIKERDNGSITIPTEQFLNKYKSVKYIDVIPLGVIKEEKKFSFGISVYPPLYSDVLYIKQDELDCIFDSESVTVLVNDDYLLSEEKTHQENTRYKALPIGKSAVFDNYDIKVDIDKFFGGHSAILGNTGSGKSCTIASIIQKLMSKRNYSAVGSSFIIMDVNGEYTKAFAEINKGNTDVIVKSYCVPGSSQDVPKEMIPFSLPHWFLNIDEWALLLQASEKTQLPILRNALGLSMLFNQSESIDSIKNHILATCITQILRDETSSPSKKDRIIAILQKFNTPEINLDNNISESKIAIGYNDGTSTRYNSETLSIRQCLAISYGEMHDVKKILDYLSFRDDEGKSRFLLDNFNIPNYFPSQIMDFGNMELALDIAILYEEAHGNRQIRDYCASMITRFKSIKERSDYKFLTDNDKSIDDYQSYINSLLGVTESLENPKIFLKESQITIMDLSNIDDEIIEVISCVLARIIYEQLKTIEPRNSFPVNIILEEAHRYISINQDRTFLKANKIFERIAKEGRKFGLFLIISSQRPCELSRTVLSQCGNFIIHRIQNPEDLIHIKQMTPHISDAILKRLPSIPTQQALIFGQAVNLPALFKVYDANPLPKSDNNQVSRNWFTAKNQPLKITLGQQ